MEVPGSVLAELAAELVVEQLVDAGSEMLYEKYLDNKVVPFTSAFLTAYLADTLEYYYHRQDMGESQQWPAEKEMKPPLIDAWARGAVPIKKKLKVTPVEQSSTPQADARSVRSSGISRVTFKPRLQAPANPTVEEPSKPKPFPLELPQEPPNPEEDRLRVDKEKELKRRQEEEGRQRKLKEEEEEMNRRVQKMATDLKNRDFTYDYAGAIMLVNPPKAERMPAYSQTVDFAIPEPIADTSPKPKRRAQTKDPASTVKPKKTPLSEVEFVRNLGTVQPPLLDSIKLNPGVVISEQGRVKRPPPEKNRKTTMSRSEYQLLVDQSAKEASVVSPVPKKAASTVGSQESAKKSSVTFSKKELLNELMDEAEELDVQSKHGSDKMSRTSKKSRKEEQFSQVDRFNMELLKAKDWGINPQGREPAVPDRMPVRPTAKDLKETFGLGNRRSRDRPFADNSKGRTRLPPPPLGQTMGHGLLQANGKPVAISKLEEEPAAD